VIRGPKTLISIQGRLGSYAIHLQPAAARILRRAGSAVGLESNHELSLLLCDGPTIRRINRQWRGKNRPTDVLSFPLHECRPGNIPPDGPLGDIVLALPVARRDSREFGVPWKRHFAHLLIHGLLHLLGHDHETARERRLMEAEEARLLGLL
jgi:probable rRNA maturation factor